MLIEPSFPYNDQSNKNKAMTLYSLQLAQGRTILSTTIKSTTVKRYLRAASFIPLNHEQMCLLLDTRGPEAQCIKDFLSEFKRWESMPNRRESITMKMLLHMHKKCKNKHSERPDPVPCDYVVLRIFYGFRLSEWE